MLLFSCFISPSHHIHSCCCLLLYTDDDEDVQVLNNTMFHYIPPPSPQIYLCCYLLLYNVDNDEKNSTFTGRKKIIPSDLHDIQSRATQVWNCGEIGFDCTVRWYKVICSYKFFQGEQKCNVQTVEQAPFWCMLLVFIQSDGQ